MDSAPCSPIVMQLKERRPEIADFLLRCERDHLTQEDYRAMRNCVRGLLSLGERQEAPQLYALAQTLRDALDGRPPAARIHLLSLSRALLSACHEALTATSASGQQARAFPPPQPPLPGSRRATLLSIDDDRIIHETIKAMFGPYAAILTAADGLEGLEMIRRHRPDLALLDDTMPKITGMQVLEALKEAPELSCVPVIMLTSSDREQDILRATKAGAVGYVIKPFDPHTLAQKVYAQLQKAIQ